MTSGKWKVLAASTVRPLGCARSRRCPAQSVLNDSERRKSPSMPVPRNTPGSEKLLAKECEPIDVGRDQCRCAAVTQILPGYPTSSDDPAARQRGSPSAL